MKQYLFLLFLVSHSLFAQTDYTQLTNWYFHPDKLINIVENYALDIAVIDKDLQVASVLEVPNNAATDTGIDIFWVHPTQLTDVPPAPTTVPLDEQPTATISATILAQGSLLAKYGRFFAPRYRQASPSAFLGSNFSDSERAAALLAAYSDIRAAFLDYLENHNNGNRIILAGHSQGAYLLGMLLRDLFDNDPALRAQLLTAALGGMGFVYTAIDGSPTGWWENISLCSLPNECGCVHNWRSFKETQTIPELIPTTPAFNQVLADSGLVYRTINLTQDRFVHDSLYYGPTSTPLRYYIAPDASYDLGEGANFIAFDSLFTVRMKRESAHKVVLAVDYSDDPTDQRPNDLLSQEAHPNYAFWGFHVKDYHIYLWALMAQIDEKVIACAEPTFTAELEGPNEHFQVYPNPTTGRFTVRYQGAEELVPGTELRLVDALGRVIERKVLDATSREFTIHTPGVYWLVSSMGAQQIIVY